ncbi:cob(I)yrinic acid a,c-diamide adenosyltransferase [Carboxydochorda subterranea]|uniref:Corrinoid adenosyltransferase n=1 Tax=Carboxydichorda subterranea TaxID=3109565 RepID=A0ABZ1BVZ6_9FIRM|nr:cob(I)yrinic acid a,c-diamide adenosyltransferase [Limnochorda sp. L945t]WRP16977.1 cob(I)yrinic acid a,c-diamide adenosyltransferase [Limnochorda sp. L945t]
MKAGGSRIYTRTGDAGETSLLGPRRVRKDDLRVEAYGCIDELNAHLGLCVAQARSAGALDDVIGALEQVQRDLFAVGAELAVDSGQRMPEGLPLLDGARVAEMERLIDALQSELPALTQFILPGGSAAGAALHVARTVARRAERQVVALAGRDKVRPEVLAYLNRLSDLLFVMARAANRRGGVGDVPWRR